LYLLMFREGEWHNFYVEKIVEIQGAGPQYILKHNSGRKLLLPADNYVKYNIAIGSILRCNVVKINCTGQIFIEPEHPFYSINNAYRFKVISAETSSIQGTDSIKVEDLFGNQINVLAPVGTAIIGNALVLNVAAIKKGVPILTFPNGWAKCNGTYHRGQLLVLYLRSIITLNDEDYYYLETEEGCISLLKIKHYKHFRIESSREIKATFVAPNPDGTIQIDPMHPLYEIGKEYSFTISGIETQKDDLSNIINLAVVYDAFAMKCGVYLDSNSYKVGDEIKCIVMGNRKGRPLLKIVP